MLCLIAEKAGGCALPGSTRGGAAKTHHGVVGPTRGWEGRQGHGCACVGASYCFCHRLARCRGAACPGHNRPLITPRAPILYRYSGEWLPLAAAVGCVCGQWEGHADGRGPVCRAKEKGKLVLAASAKGTLFPGLTVSGPGGGILRHGVNLTVSCTSGLSATIHKSLQNGGVSRRLGKPLGRSPSATECRTKWLGLICQEA